MLFRSGYWLSEEVSIFTSYPARVIVGTGGIRRVDVRQKIVVMNHISL